MVLVSGRVDEPQHPRKRDIASNCGQLLGRLDELLPCLYIAQTGATARDLRRRRTEAAPGLFAIAERTAGERPRGAPASA